MCAPRPCGWVRNAALCVLSCKHCDSLDVPCLWEHVHWLDLNQCKSSATEGCQVWCKRCGFTRDHDDFPRLHV